MTGIATCSSASPQPAHPTRSRFATLYGRLPALESGERPSCSGRQLHPVNSPHGQPGNRRARAGVAAARGDRIRNLGRAPQCADHAGRIDARARESSQRSPGSRSNSTACALCGDMADPGDLEDSRSLCPLRTLIVQSHEIARIDVRYGSRGDRDRCAPGRRTFATPR